MTNRIDYARVAPDAVKALSATRPYLAATAIEPRLRALVELRVSQINGCAYCVDTHSSGGAPGGRVSAAAGLPASVAGDTVLRRPRAGGTGVGGIGHACVRDGCPGRSLQRGRSALRRERPGRSDGGGGIDECLEPDRHQLPPGAGCRTDVASDGPKRRTSEPCRLGRFSPRDRGPEGMSECDVILELEPSIGPGGSNGVGRVGGRCRNRDKLEFCS